VLTQLILFYNFSKPLSGLFRGDAAVLEASGFSGLAEGEAMNVTAIDISAVDTSAPEVFKLPKIETGGSRVRLDDFSF
jgi:hypothetical protein